MDSSDFSAVFQQSTISMGEIEALTALFKEMDAAYEATVSHYGFVCNGCEENCCYTRFDHHTVSELINVYNGFRRLSRDDRDRLRAAARTVVDADPDTRPLCPANIGGLCRIYAHRPMICRMHGPASELRHPTAGVKQFPGCQAFHDHCGNGAIYHPFDRTPFYRKMADIERRLQQRLGIAVKPRMTVAEMILVFPMDDECNDSEDLE